MLFSHGVDFFIKTKTKLPKSLYTLARNVIYAALFALITLPIIVTIYYLFYKTYDAAILVACLSFTCLLTVIYLLIYFSQIEKNALLESLHNLLNEQRLAIVYIMQNLKERKILATKLMQLAHYDQLTGLPNKILYGINVNTGIKKAKVTHSRLFILYLDLDNFKNINNILGHHLGDLYLKELARQLKKCLGPQDIISRFGGDEFFFALTTIDSVNDAITFANKLIKMIRSPLKIKKYDVTSGCSIGIAVYPDHGIDIDTLIKSADIALSNAKLRGKGTIQLYDEKFNLELQRQIKLENYLRAAIKNNELHIDFQPQFDLKNRQIVSIEALMRWEHPVLGIVQPDTFIPLAEKIGIITTIGEWVLKDACKYFKSWQDAGLVDPNTKISINLSIIQVEQVDFLQTVIDILKTVAVDPKCIELELTESIISTTPDTVFALFKNLSSLGVSIVMDDFGTGYSSFSRLSTFPLNSLKIDKSFFYIFAQKNQDIINSIISLAHNLGLKVVAEGIESEEQFEFLRAGGCDYVQGFYLCPPYDATRMKHYLTDLKNKAI